MTKQSEFIMELSNLYGRVFKFVDRRLSTHSITFSEFFVMYQLSLAPDKAMRRIDLAEAVGMSASGVTRLLAPMEKLLLVAKEQNERDARVSLVRLTDVGAHVLSEAMGSFEASGDMLLGKLTNEDLERFFALSKAIV